MRSNFPHCTHCLIDVGSTIDPAISVQIKKHNEARPRHPLVSVGKGMIPRQSTRQHGSLFDRVRVEILISKAGSWSVKRRVCEIASTHRLEGAAGNTRHLFGEKPELSKAEISGHSARRLMISRSRSSSIRARATKSASRRTRAISASSDSMMSWFKLSPRTRATVSASAARSSGNLTVVCLDTMS